MKKIFTLFFFASLFTTCSLHAQKTTTTADQQATLTLLKKDTAYSLFMNKLDAIMKTAKGRKTNAIAVKALFENNKMMFQRLQKKYDIDGLKVTTSNPVVSVKPLEISAQEKPKILPVNIKLYKAPFTEKKIFTFDDEDTPAQETGSDASTGKIAYTTATDHCILLGPAVYGFRQKITVPSDPLITYAKVRFYFSFYHTGWDTYYAQVQFYLALKASANFICYDYNQMESAGYPMENWKTPFKLAPNLSCTDFTVVTDFNRILDSSFAIEGYVTPGSDLNFIIGPCHRSNNYVGNSGSYHYSEFILKKITVTYLKNQE